MKKAYSIRWLSMFIFFCLINNYSFNATAYATQAKDTLSVIAGRCRANREMLNSFDCEYTRSRKTHTDARNESIKRKNPNLLIDTPKQMSYKGRFAFYGNKALSREGIEGTDSYYHYIKNGNQIRIATNYNPRTIVLGTVGAADIRPPIPDPWTFAGGHSLIYKLDKLDGTYDKVVSVKPIIEKDRELVVVEIEQRLNISPENQMVNLLTIHFSIQDGYLPVKVRQDMQSKPGEKSPYVSEASVDKVLRYDIGGNTLYLPASYQEKVYRSGELSSTSDFNIPEESVKINPELPDDLFRIDIQPGEIIVNKDLGIQYRAPADGIIGAQAPDFTLEMPGNDQKVTLSKVKEDVIVLDFWATWCGPCKKITPALEALHKWAKENNKSVAFYCINQKEESGIAAAYWKEQGYNIPVLLDSDGAVFSAYKGTGIPYVIIISNGIIRNAHIGSGAEVHVLEQYIKNMIVTALED